MGCSRVAEGYKGLSGTNSIANCKVRIANCKFGAALVFIQFAICNLHFAICNGFLFCVAVSVSAAEPVRLTTDGLTKFGAVTRQGGQEIVYVDFVQGATYRLQRLTLKTGNVERLHPQATTSEFEPTFSADGRYYAYLRLRGLLNVHIVIHHIETRAEIEVSPGPGLAGIRTPALAPDASRVVFSFAEKSRQQLYTVDIKGENRQPLTDSPGINIAPSFSPDGKRIAFCSTRDGNYEIYTMDADGKDVVRLTDSSFQDLRPGFSPDGQRIAFTSHRDGNAEIYVMNADGTRLRRITHHPERDDYAAWHDVRRLVVVSERDGEQDLYLVDLEE
jgi:tricorn protease-like protein